MPGVSRKLRLVFLTLFVAGAVTACVPAPTPAVTVVQTTTATVTATPTATPSPTPTPEPVPEVTQPPAPPAPPVPPNAMGGQTDGGNTATTPLVSDGGPQQFAVGTATAINDYEYSYTVAAGDQVLAIASRFSLQTDDVVRVNFRCSDPLEVQPGDVLDIRWPIDSEAVGSGCVKSVTG